MLVKEEKDVKTLVQQADTPILEEPESKGAYGNKQVVGGDQWNKLQGRHESS